MSELMAFYLALFYLTMYMCKLFLLVCLFFYGSKHTISYVSPTASAWYTVVN